MTNNFRTVAKALQSRPDVKNFLASDKPMKEIFELDIPLPKDRVAFYRNLYSVIEDTGCYNVHLPNNNLLRIKMEYSNSMGNNHYSRYWIPYLFIAEAFEVITPGKTQILEVSSGSAGISLAIACKELDYDLTMIVPSLLPQSRTKPILDSGAKVISVNGYIDKCIIKLKELLSTGKYFAANHCEEASNFAVHTFSRIASEYYQKFDSPDYTIIGTGNGTTTEAIFRYFRKKLISTRLYTYHPRTDGNQIIFGLYGQPVKLRHVENALTMAERIFYTNEIDLTETIDYFRTDSEISNLGASSLYGIHLAKLVADFESDKTFMSIGYDKKDRY